MFFSCRSCSRNFPENRYKELMDEYLEAQLANVPINRI
ncbi:MAG: dual CXXC motif small (seleno)protein [Desulfotignum sp.]